MEITADLGLGSQSFRQQLRRGIVIPSGGAFTKNLTVAIISFYGIVILNSLGAIGWVFEFYRTCKDSLQVAW